jgi:hypothetical protein
VRLHPHLIFEALAYLFGARLYFSGQRRHAAPGAPLPLETRLWVLVGCIFGAWAGSRLLAWAEQPTHYLALAQTNPILLFGAKTIAGGLLGGWAGVEIAKARCGVRRSTGDDFVWPLAAGTAIGRLGCFFTGLDDQTYGVATSLPWGVDFGDRITRHPTQLYESAAVLLLAAAIAFAARGRTWPAGTRFRLYFAGYFAFRFGVEFIKPRETLLTGLSAIQLASAVGVVVSSLSLRRPAPAGPAT